MITIERTTAENHIFKELVIKLDSFLSITDGDEHEFYDQFNKLDTIQHVVLAFDNNKAVACGAIKPYKNAVIEIKRMFTLPECRGKGVASTILKELEIWALELNFTSCILETGVNQVEAIGLYKKNNYTVITNYPPYENAENSICFEKKLK